MSRSRPTALVYALVALLVAFTGCAGEVAPAPRASESAPRDDARVPEAPQAPTVPEPIRGPHGLSIEPAAPEVLAVLAVRGIPYTGLADEIARLRLLLERQGIASDAPARAIYTEDPSIVDGAEYRYRLAVPVAADAYPRPPLLRVRREARIYARVAHRGDFDVDYQVRAFETVPRAIIAMGFAIVGPVEEVYRFEAGSDPSTWETVVRYPVAPPAKSKPEPEAKPKKR